MALPFSFTAALAGVFWAVQAHAQTNPHLLPEGPLGSCNFMTGELSYDCIPLYVSYAINTVFGFIGTICLLQIIYGGYEWATGNLTGKTEEGKTRIRNAIISFVIALLSFAIVDMIVSVVVQ